MSFEIVASHEMLLRSNVRMFWWLVKVIQNRLWLLDLNFTVKIAQSHHVRRGKWRDESTDWGHIDNKIKIKQQQNVSLNWINPKLSSSHSVDTVLFHIFSKSVCIPFNPSGAHNNFSTTSEKSTFFYLLSENVFFKYEFNLRSLVHTKANVVFGRYLLKLMRLLLHKMFWMQSNVLCLDVVFSWFLFELLISIFYNFHR